MIFSYPKGEPPLTARVITAEQQLHHREGTVRARASRLTEGFRDRLVSPASLAMAAGAGFLIGELTARRPAPQPGHADASPAAARPAGLAASLFPVVQKLYGLARPLLLTYVEERLRQYVHSGAAQEQPEEPAPS